MANISDFISAGGGGGGLTPVLANDNDEQISASSGDYYIVTAAGVQITLPASPSTGDVVRVYNRGGQDEIVIVFPGRIPVVDPQSEAPIRGQIELRDTASYEFTYDGSSWNLVFSGYFVGTPSATSGLELGYIANVNSPGTITFALQTGPAPFVDSTVGTAVRTDQTARISAVVTDPDQAAGVAFIYNWPSLVELNANSAGNTFVIVSGGGSADDFIEISNTVEESVLIDLTVIDSSGNEITAQYNHIVADNLAPIVSLTAGAGTAEVGNDIVTRITNVTDDATTGVFPANAASYTINWVVPTGATIIDGCELGDQTCTLQAAAELRNADLVATVEDSAGGVGMATRQLTWAQAGPIITARNLASTSNAVQAFSATAPAIGGDFHTFIGSYDGMTLPAQTPLTGDTLTATVMESPCPSDHTQNWYSYGHNPVTGSFTASSTASSVLSFNGSNSVAITTTGLTAASAVPAAPLSFGGIRNSSGGSIVTNCAGAQVSSSWSITSDIQVFSRWYHVPGTGGAATLSTGETDATVAIGSAGGAPLKRAAWSGTLTGSSTAARTATAVAPTVHRMGFFSGASGTGGAITNIVGTTGGTSTRIVAGNAGGGVPSAVIGAVPVNVTASMSNGVGTSATWASGSQSFTNGGNGSAGTFTGTVTWSGGTNNTGTITVNGTFNPTDTRFTPGSTLDVSLRTSIFPTIGGATRPQSDYRLVHDFIFRITA